MPVRVLWVIKGLGPGGAETLLANAAAVHDRSAFHIECVFVLPSKDQLVDRLEAAGVRAMCVSRRERDWRWPIRLCRHIRAGGYRVVHVHSPLPGAVARLATRAMGKRGPCLVTTEHNAWGTYRWPTRLLNRLTSRWDDDTFTVSDEARRSMRGRAADRAVTLTHGINVAATAALRTERTAVRDELGIPADAFVIGTVANFREQKDYPNLLGAARSYLDAGGNATWVVVGQGPLEQQTQQLARELGLGSRVVFTGYRPDAARVQSAFDVFTLASKWEGLPVAMMEALALGLPVAATAVGGVAEVLADGESALLVPSSDPMSLAAAWRQLADDAVLRDRLSVATTSLSTHFDVRSAQNSIETVYIDRAGASAAASAEVPAAKPKRQRLSLDIRPLIEADEPELMQLLGRSLGWNEDPRFRDLFRWKHVENAFGPSFGWAATDGGRVVGVRLFMRWSFRTWGGVLHAVRAVDTATDPAYQGRGIFTALTMHGLDAVGAAGVDFVFNTPNSQSKPGYLKMGWEEGGRVPVLVHPVGLPSMRRLLSARVPAEHWSVPVSIGSTIESWLARNGYPDSLDTNLSGDLRTAMSADILRWRYSMPHLHYRVVDSGSGSLVVRLRRRGSARELVVATTWGLAPSEVARAATRIGRDLGADYVVRVSRSGLLPRATAPFIGPVLTWRHVNSTSIPPLRHWRLEMGDLELM